MNYLRHPNGRGKLFDDAEANRGVYLDKTSSAVGMAKLRDCRLTGNSEARDECQVYGGFFHASIIAGKTIVAGHPKVVGSALRCSEVSGSPVIRYSFLQGSTEVCDFPDIKRSRLTDCIVYGNPVISDVIATGGRIHEGIWFRPPKHIKLPWCELTECIDGKVILDCRCRTIDYWLRHGPKLGKRFDWSHDMIDVTLETIRREFMPTNPLPGLPHETIMRV